MEHQFGVTIASSLEDAEICSTKSFPHVCVLDLRRCVNNGPLPVRESTLRKLKNFRVDYDQIPMTFYNQDRRSENLLYLGITQQQGNVLVLTDEPVPLARFCQQMNIPFKSRDLFIVETAEDYVPVQAKAKRNGAAFGSLAS